MRIVWIAWFIAIVISFVIFESWALSHENGLSLSQATVDMIYAWPPVGPIMGIIIGILICHFFWHWVPKQKKETCQVCGKTILKN